jgi:hypothetical protein
MAQGKTAFLVSPARLGGYVASQLADFKGKTEIIIYLL